MVAGGAKTGFVKIMVGVGGRSIWPGVRVGRAVACGGGVSLGTGEESTATKVCWQALVNMSMIEANTIFILDVILFIVLYHGGGTWFLAPDSVFWGLYY
jgi:hypothetical protein